MRGRRWSWRRFAVTRSIPEVGRDTTVFLAHDAAGNICCGTSTSGWGWKYPGRLGDSPIVGAGCYADTRYGAAACTGAGEMTIRCGTARSVVLYMKRGASVADAVLEAAEDMRALQGGLLSRVTIHAIDTRGNHKVVAVNGAGDNVYWLWSGDGAPQSLRARAGGHSPQRNQAERHCTICAWAFQPSLDRPLRAPCLSDGSRLRETGFAPKPTRPCADRGISGAVA